MYFLALSWTGIKLNMYFVISKYQQPPMANAKMEEEGII